MSLLAIIGALALWQNPSAATPVDQAHPPMPTQDVCLTNACGPELKTPADPATIGAAIQAGEVLKVMASGGTAEQAMQAARALQERLRPPGQPYNAAGGFDRFADASDGSTYAVRPAANIATPPGITVVAGIERRYPDGRTEVMHLLSNGAALTQPRAPAP